MDAQSPLATAAPEPPSDSAADLDYWFELIAQPEAAKFRGVTERKMERDRQTGDGPKFVRLSARCIRYRRIDLRADAEKRMVRSTAESDATP